MSDWSDDIRAVRVLARPAALVRPAGAAVKLTSVQVRSRSLIIGRGASAWLRLDDEYVSQHHARIVWAEGTWTLRELAANGTWIDGDRVPTGVEVPLTDDSVLRLGTTEVRLLLVAPPRELRRTSVQGGAVIPLMGLTAQQREVVSRIAGRPDWRCLLDVAADQLEAGMVGDLSRSHLAQASELSERQVRGRMHRINAAFGHTGRDATRRSAHIWSLVREQLPPQV